MRNRVHPARAYLGVTALLLSTLGGCATPPAPSGLPIHPAALAAPSERLSRLFIYRDHSTIYGALDFRILLNGAEIGGITNGTYLYADLKPGAYTVSLYVRDADGNGDPTKPYPQVATVNVGDPGNYYVRVAHPSLGKEIAVAAMIGAVAGIAHMPAYMVQGPVNGLALHPETVGDAEAKPEIAALAYCHAPTTPVPGQQPKLGLSYEMLAGLSAGEHGGRVTLVLPDSPAAHAGIVPDDILISVDGAPVTDKESVHQILGGKARATPVKLAFYHQGKPVEASTVL